MTQSRTVYPLQATAQFGVFLRALRRSHGLTQRDLGPRIGVTGARVSEIERDSSAVGLTQILTLLHVLGASVVVELDEKRADAGRGCATPPGPGIGWQLSRDHPTTIS